MRPGFMLRLGVPEGPQTAFGRYLRLDIMGAGGQERGVWGGQRMRGQQRSWHGHFGVSDDNFWSILDISLLA
jgi:hypothetical protein